MRVRGGEWFVLIFAAAEPALALQVFGEDFLFHQRADSFGDAAKYALPGKGGASRQKLAEHYCDSSLHLAAFFHGMVPNRLALQDLEGLAAKKRVGGRLELDFEWGMGIWIVCQQEIGK